MVTKLGRVVAKIEGLFSIKSGQVVLQDHVTN